jgi:hypothetical protein
MRYERALLLTANAMGQACAVLDASVFAHTASNAANDLRVFASRPGGPQVETPFALTESGPPSTDVQTASVHNLNLQNGQLDFDLSMPPRPYTEVDLEIHATNFLGVAEVSGIDPQRATRTPLGRHTIFDLSSRGLARSTAFTLPESTYPELHIELRLTDLDGRPLASLSPAILSAASVPPSRSAQTLYTTVATLSGMDEQGQWSLATATIPAHVPVERVRFVPDPKYTRDFLRDVTIAATPMTTPMPSGGSAVSVAESVPGQIFRVARRAPAGMPAIDAQQLYVDAPLGSNLRSAAMVMASVHNTGGTPLPIQRVELQMRERRVCFQAAPGVAYTLRYGDPSLPPPTYAYMNSFVAAASPAIAELGPERLNPHFTARSGMTTPGSPHSETPWLVLIAVIVISGVVALQRMRRQEDQGS